MVEKDYVIGWVLWGIGADQTLSTTWAFKGGTSLKKCYLETYRFSEDLDFTVLPGGPIRAEELTPILQRVLDRVHQQSGIVFTDRAPLLKTHASGNYTEGRVYYRGPRNTPGVASLRLDLSASGKWLDRPCCRKLHTPIQTNCLRLERCAVTASMRYSRKRFVRWASEAVRAIFTTSSICLAG